MFGAVFKGLFALREMRNAVILSKSATQIDALGRRMKEKKGEEKRPLTTGIGLSYENEHRWF